MCSRCDDNFDTDFQAEDILIWEPEVVCVGCASREELEAFDAGCDNSEAGCEEEDW